MRARGRATKQPTPKQSISQTLHASFIARFAALSAADRTLWDIFALANTKENAFGQSKILTGQNWYESVNFFRELLGQATLDQPPVHVLPIPQLTITATIGTAPGTTGTLSVDFTPAPTQVANGIVIYTTTPLTRTTTSLEQYWRLTFSSVNPVSDPLDITSEYEATHEIGIPNNTTRFNFMIGVMVRLVRLSSGIARAGVFDLPTSKSP